jgi:hypothetical protein
MSPVTTLFGLLRRERHALLLLAALLFATQWMVPVAFAGTVDDGICFGDSDSPGHAHEDIGCCPGMVGCKLPSGDRLSSAEPGAFPAPNLTGSAFGHRQAGDSARPSGLNPHDADGRGPPSRS